MLRSLEAGPDVMRRHAMLLGASFLVAFVGADALIRATPGSSTRFERWIDVAAPVAVVGALAAFAALRWRLALWIAWAAAAVLFVCPTLAGHALDGDQPRLLAPLGDLLHLGAAAVWLGGLASLLLVVPGRRRAGAHGGGAALLGASRSRWCSCSSRAASARALTELDSVSQLWSTSYGRALLVKSGLLLVLARARLDEPPPARRRVRSAAADRRSSELLVLLVIVGAVGMLTDLRPGSGARHDAGGAPTTPPPPVAQPPPAPPRGAYRRRGARPGSSRSASPTRTARRRVTLTTAAATASRTTPVTIDGQPGEDCGRGCFSRAGARPGVTVDVGGTAAPTSPSRSSCARRPPR